jgi:hypothetical protein
MYTFGSAWYSLCQLGQIYLVDDYLPFLATLSHFVRYPLHIRQLPTASETPWSSTTKSRQGIISNLSSSCTLLWKYFGKYLVCILDTCGLNGPVYNISKFYMNLSFNKGFPKLATRRSTIEQFLLRGYTIVQI